MRSDLLAELLERLLVPWKVVTCWIAAFAVVTAVGGMIKFRSIEGGIAVFGNDIAPVSLIVTSMSLCVFTWRFGYKGTALFFMGAGFYDAGFDSLTGGIHLFRATLSLDPIGLMFSTLLVPVGWWYAGRPSFHIDLYIVPVVVSYFLLYPPPVFDHMRFDMGVVPSMFFYLFMEMKRDEREREIQV